jgi:hypothetical protein
MASLVTRYLAATATLTNAAGMGVSLVTENYYTAWICWLCASIAGLFWLLILEGNS